MSSPEKSVAQHRVQKATNIPTPEIDDSVVLLEERPAANKRLRRATDNIQDTRNRKLRKVKGQPEIGMFLDTAAVNSDHEDTASDTDEEIDPET